MKPLQIFDKIDRFLCCKLPVNLRVRWARLWVRRDEFHPSLDSDAEYAWGLSQVERHTYWADLMNRREMAHKRDLAN